MKKRIVITGIGAITPIGSQKDAFAKALKEGKSGISLIEHFDTANFPTKIGGVVKDFNPDAYIEKKKIKRMARFTQIGYCAAIMAIEDSKLDLAKEDLSRVGVITGTGMGGLDIIEEEEQALLSRGPKRVSPFLIPMLIANMLPGEIAIRYGFCGPN
jgi:3-oxoacyl-[acyl-carrier-protein] synthase II